LTQGDVAEVLGEQISEFFARVQGGSVISMLADQAR